MKSRICKQPPRQLAYRRGLSLLELMLVMALLVTVAALAMPAVGTTLDRHQLRNAGELVRTTWARARVKAMDSGRTYVFRYQLSGREFVVEPWVSDDDYLESDQLGMAGGAPPLGRAETMPGVYFENDLLPDTITFMGSEITQDSRGALINELTGALSDTAWSPPIYFYADGTTSTARVVLVNQRGRVVNVRIRGLTGMVTASGIESQVEVSQ